jgi:hypothetical protein
MIVPPAPQCGLPVCACARRSAEDAAKRWHCGAWGRSRGCPTPATVRHGPLVRAFRNILRSLVASGLVELALVTAAAVVLATLARADLRAGRENDDGPAPVRGTGPSVTA